MENDKVNSKSYITIPAWMVNELDLHGNELLCYAILFGFCQDGESEFSGSRKYLADWLGCTLPTVDRVLSSLIEKNLITKRPYKKNNITFNAYAINNNPIGLGSKKILYPIKNFDKGCKNSLHNNLINYLFNNNDCTSITEQNNNINYNNITSTHDNKEKEKSLKKEKENLDLSLAPSDEFKAVLVDWLEYKKEKKQPYKQRGLNMLIKKLIQLSGGDVQKARKIVEQSMMCNYAGLFPLKEDDKRKRNLPKGMILTEDDVREMQEFNEKHKEDRIW